LSQVAVLATISPSIETKVGDEREVQGSDSRIEADTYTVSLIASGQLSRVSSLYDLDQIHVVCLSQPHRYKILTSPNEGRTGELFMRITCG